MEENQNENQLYHFSKNVLALSIFFLLINIAWYGLVVFKRTVDFREVSPELIFAAQQDVVLKTSFDKNYFPATPNQMLLTNTRIKTGEQSFAEIKLEGNTVRLDQNTEVILKENNFNRPDLPRFVFGLESGSVWVNAFDSIVIEASQGEAYFAHSVGVYTYTDPLNRVMAITGTVDLTLLDEKGDVLSYYVVPLKNQVTFVDSQLIPDYRRLEYTKLKKELKMGPVASSILEEDWVKRNTRDDVAAFMTEDNTIFSSSVYRILSRYHSLREKLALVPSQKRMERLNLAKTKLRYLLGGVHAENDKELAQSLLTEFDLLKEKLAGDSVLDELIRHQFYAIRNVKINTPAYLLKENLREHLISEESPAFLRTYLVDLDYLMRVSELEQSFKVAEIWLTKWKQGLRSTYFDEFEKQTRIYHNIMLAYSDTITSDLLAILDRGGNYRLKESGNAEETLFEIALERLEMSKYLVASQRFADAKNYLKTSYAKLKLDEQETAAAARDIFIKDAALIAERITFAEQQSLRGVAEPAADDEGFKDYLSTQERDKQLEEQFIAFLQEAEVEEEKAVYPTIDDVSKRFSTTRIVVLDEDIIGDPEFPFDFEVKSARLIDRSRDGTSVIFSSKYDYSTNAIYEIMINEEGLAGSYTLNDFVRIAIAGEAEAEPETDIGLGEGSIADFLNITESEEAERSQVIAQDLAIQLMIKELEFYNISVSSGQQVSVLNAATLNEFRVKDVFIEDSETSRRLSVSFDYNSTAKILSDFSFDNFVLDIPSQLKPEEFISAVFEELYVQEEEQKAFSDVINEFGKLNLILKKEDLSFVPGQRLNVASFKKVRMKAMPIEFSGTYDRSSSIFLTATHELLSDENVSSSEYNTELAELWAIDYLGKQGIIISQENIMSNLPVERISIKDYARGDKILDFTYNVVSNNLSSIVLQATGATVDSMTFEEFALIEGGVPPPSPAQSQPESEEEEEAEEGTEGEEGEAVHVPIVLFYSSLNNCNRVKAVDEDEGFELEITGSEGDDCIVHYLVMSPTNPDFADAQMNCLIPKGVYDAEDYREYWSDNLFDVCVGSYVDLLSSIFE